MNAKFHDAAKYVSRIRNPYKKLYAQIWLHWKTSPEYTGYYHDFYTAFPTMKTLPLGVMGKQAVEMNIAKLLGD